MEQIIGFTAGNFDLIHPGYIYTFEEAKRHCNYFMVFLQRDPSETRFTKYKPVIPLYERYKTLMAIKYVDEVKTYTTEDQLYQMLVDISPDIRIIGSDWKNNPQFTGGDLDIQLHFHDRNHNHSTTNLRKRVYKAESND